MRTKMRTKVMALLLPLFSLTTTAWADVEVNKRNFPDGGFRGWVERNCGSILTTEKIASKNMFSVAGSNIRFMKGIEYFTALKTLFCYRNQIKGAGMDALIESLPNTNDGRLAVIWYENEGNVMTTKQVESAKAKGWIPYYYYRYYNEDNNSWEIASEEYSGSKPVDTPVATGDVEINERYFPDDAFRKWLLNREYGQDGVLTENEIASITSLKINNSDIISLRGIEYFTALTSLDCGGNWLTKLDVSNNTALTYLDCGYNYLTTLDVSKNTALAELRCYENELTTLDVSKNTALVYLNCGNNNFTTFKPQNTALKSLICNDNQLTVLDLSKSIALTEVQCRNNQLTTLDLSENIALTEVQCDNNQLTTLDLSKNSALRSLDCYYNQIRDEGMDALVESLPTAGYASMCIIGGKNEQNVMNSTQVALAKVKGWRPKNFPSYQDYPGSVPNYLTIPNNIAINETNFPDENFRNWVLSQEHKKDAILTDEEIGSFTSVDVSNKNIQSLKGIEYFVALTQLSCNNNQLATIDVSNNTELIELFCNNNLLTTLDVPGNIQLRTLKCSNNQLTELGVSENPQLRTLECNNNQLTKLDVSKNMQLRTLSCSKNQLTTLDASNHTDLVGFACSENPLNLVDLSGCTALTKLWIDPLPAGWSDPMDVGQITSLNLSGCTSLEMLSCRCFKMKTLDLSGCHALKTLYCEYNELSGLDLSDCAALEELICGDNQLAELNVSGCAELTYLACINNQLSKLDVSNCIVLEDLYCHDNQLKTLDVTGCTALEYLYCYNNQLTALNVTGLTALKYLECNNNQLMALDVTGCAALKKLECNDNQLTTLDFTGCTALEELECWLNKIKGTGMDVLVESLPTVSEPSNLNDDYPGEMLVVWNENEQNEMTTTQVETARAKGWYPKYRMYSDGLEDWRNYDGCNILYDKAPNDVLALNTGNAIDIMLQGRTLHKDGNWNTLCLPFSISESEMAKSTNPLYGATIMELDTYGIYDTNKQTGFDAASGTLYLYFKEATGIEAGKPYMVKWDSGSDISDPIFRNVTVESTSPATIEATNGNLRTVQFIGTYSPTTIAKDDKSSLVLIGGNKLGYPSVEDYDVNSCRAYFHVDLGGGEVKAFVLGFDNETTSIQDVQYPLTSSQSDSWTDLNGRRMNRKPGMKGIYMNNGKKVVIK